MNNTYFQFFIVQTNCCILFVKISLLVFTNLGSPHGATFFYGTTLQTSRSHNCLDFEWVFHFPFSCKLHTCCPNGRSRSFKAWGFFRVVLTHSISTLTYRAWFFLISNISPENRQLCFSFKWVFSAVVELLSSPLIPYNCSIIAFSSYRDLSAHVLIKNI